MLLQILLGCVALGGMQAVKPLNNKKQKNNIQTYSFTMNVDELTNYDADYIDHIDIYYSDSKSNNVKTIDPTDYINPDTDEYNNTITFNLIGYDHLYLSEIDFLIANLSELDIANKFPTQQYLSGNYKIQEYDTYTTFEVIRLDREQNEYRQDTEMYTILNYQPGNIFNGWFAFDNKYTYTYGENETLYFDDPYEENNLNTVFALPTTDNTWDTSQNFKNFYVYPIMKNDQYRVNQFKLLNKVLYQKDNEAYLTRTIVTKNIYYLGNVKVSNNVWEYYNVYRINKPQELDSNIINKSFKVNDYNPYGYFGYEYNQNPIPRGRPDSQTPGGSQEDVRILNWVLQGLALIDNDRYTQWITSYFNRLPIAPYKIDRNYNISSLDIDINYRYWTSTDATNLDGYTMVLAEPLTTTMTDNNEKKVCVTEKVKLNVNTITILFNNNTYEPYLEASFTIEYVLTGDTTSDVFTLIAHGFKSWQVLFEFKLGNIPLGQIIFAPFIVGFIIWLIHLVKRG